MAVFDNDLMELTRRALNIVTTMKSTVERGVKEKVNREIPWTVDELVAVLCGESSSGFWHKSWIVFYFKTLAAARMFYALINVRSITPEIAWKSTDVEHAYAMAEKDGLPLVRARYDFFVSSSSHVSSGAGAYAMLVDASSGHFIPPPRTQGVWHHPPRLDPITLDGEPTAAEGAGGDDDDVLEDISWDQTRLGDDLTNSLDNPDDFDIHQNYAADKPLNKGQVRAREGQTVQGNEEAGQDVDPGENVQQKTGCTALQVHHACCHV